MWSNKNVVNVTKAAISQLVDKGYMDIEDGNLTALDDHIIIDLGEKISAKSDGSIDVNTPADIFFKALLSQMGKIVVDTRSYVAELPKLYVDTVNWGLFSEYVEIDLSDVMTDEMWNSDGFINFSSPAGTDPVTLSGQAEGARIAAIEFGCYKPPVRVKMYKKVHGIMVALTTAREQFFTAFRGLDEYSSFLAGLFNSVENTLQVKAEIYAHMCVCMGIATAKANNNEINVLHEYNTLTNGSLTAMNCWKDPCFTRYVAKRIADIKYNIRRYNAAYNNHEHLTYSAEPNVILLNQVANNIKFDVAANTYHDNLIGIGEFDTVASWQSVVSTTDTVPYNFTTASTVSLTNDAAKEAGINIGSKEKPVENAGLITGVIGVVYDRMAMGITVDRRKTTSQYAASRDTTNYFYHSLVQYIVNNSYPIVTIVVRDN